VRATILVAVYLVLGSALGLSAADKKADRHVEKAGGFSFVPPEDFLLKELPGMKYKAAIGPAAGGFAPNIVFVDEAHKGTLAEYVEANKKGLKMTFKNYKEISEKNLKTDAGAECAMLRIQRDEKGKALRQTFYFFELSPERKMVATASTAVGAGEKWEPILEASVKTFRLEKR
jgi:hypothetical protein